MTMIEWCTDTWDPVGGCSDCSAGCAHCWAREGTVPSLGRKLPEPHSRRYLPLVKPARHRAIGRRYHWTGELFTWPDRFAIPLRKRKPQRYFVCSQSDLFHEGRADDVIDIIVGLCILSHWHTHLLLTKRAARMAAYWRGVEDRAQDKNVPTAQMLVDTAIAALRAELGDDAAAKLLRARAYPADLHVWPPRNIWPGVTMENKEAAEGRGVYLMSMKAAKRWVSYEPALSPVTFGGWLLPQAWPGDDKPRMIDWIIAGAESGPGARHAPLEWVRSVRDQVVAARSTSCANCLGIDPVSCVFRHEGPALFIKQWDVCSTCGGCDKGCSECPECNCTTGQTGKVRKGCPAIDGRVWDEVPR